MSEGGDPVAWLLLIASCGSSHQKASLKSFVSYVIIEDSSFGGRTMAETGIGTMV
jgi:hypothetical protein